MAVRSKDISEAKKILEKGGLVAIPTETVYGLAANALEESAIIRIYKAKNRPAFDPLIAHVSGFDQVSSIAADVPELGKKLMEKFWPGPLTLLLPKKPAVPDILTSGLPRVAVRMPDHPLTLALLQQLEFPLAAPSANPFGYVSPTTADHVMDQLGDSIDMILDGGPTRVGVESTIVSLEHDTIVVNRVGGLSLEQLNPFGKVLLNVNQSSNPSAPGMLKSHYAPGKKLIIGDIDALMQQYAHYKYAILSFYKDYRGPNCIVLSPEKSLETAAKNLFAALRELDKKDIDIILTESFPDHGLGRAINDRLRRASASN